jgi:hypothetical protein
MNREDIKKYLQMLGLELQKQEVMGQILLAEGVVMLLDVRKPEDVKDVDAYVAYLRGDGPPVERRKDIDVRFGGRGAAIREIAASIAGREGLPNSWLQDALKDFFFTLPSREKWVEYPGLRAYVAPTEYVLAMKVAAFGCPQDIEDIKILASKLQISTAQDMLACIMKYVPEELLTAEMQLHVEQAFVPAL